MRAFQREEKRALTVIDLGQMTPEQQARIAGIIVQWLREQGEHLVEDAVKQIRDIGEYREGDTLSINLVLNLHAGALALAMNGETIGIEPDVQLKAPTRRITIGPHGPNS